MEAVVLFDYNTQESDELTLKKGDVISKIQKREGGWWEGTIKDGRRGLFPGNFVEVISDDIGSSESGTPLRGKKFKVKYNYIPVSIDELELNVGEVVEVLSEIEEGWWEGRLNNKIGVFPSNFVTELTEPEVTSGKESHTTIPVLNQISQDAHKMEIEEPKTLIEVVPTSDAPALPPKPKPIKEMCIALFPYEAKHEDELTLKENDMIILLSTDLPDKGWWKGQLNGKIGVFPDNFVKLVSLGEEVAKPKRPVVTNSTTNKIRDNINKKTTNLNVASLRKSLETPVKVEANPIQYENVNSNKKPAVSKKPGFSQSSSSESMKALFSSPPRLEKMSSFSPERNFNTSGNSLSFEMPPLVKSDSEGKSWIETTADSCKKKPDSALMGEKVNTEIHESFAIKELDSTDGTSGSKIYAINNSHDSHIGNNNKMNKKQNTSEKEMDFNAIERSELLTHPTASRARAPKRRPPSGINVKEDENVQIAGSKPYNSKVTVNGTADVSQDKLKGAAPWLQELKLSQVKKNSSSQVSIRSGFTSTGSNVTFRFQRPVSMFSGDIDSHTMSVQSKSLPSSTEQVTFPPTTSSTKTVVPNGKMVTISVSEWNTLNDKVNTLEMRLEMQNEYFVKAVEQLKLKLAREIELRLEMKNEMDKLMDLVTQV